EPAGAVICPTCAGDPQYICAACNTSGSLKVFQACRHVVAVPVPEVVLECGHQAHEIVSSS
ncbi:MAG TPA: hypothetical protein VLT15_08070, partial [Acidimicrobiia bacterium]|nr:hypothetical protein [Acidimicrobiia bacterium]